MSFYVADKNTIVMLDGIGSFELRYISVNDLTVFADLMVEFTDNYNFAVECLYRQLISPTMIYSDFLLLTEPSIHALLSAFILEAGPSEVEVTGDVYADFRVVIEANIKSINDSTYEMSMAMRSITQNLLQPKLNLAPLYDQISFAGQEMARLAEQFNTSWFNTVQATFNHQSDWVKNLQRAGLTPNLGDDRSITRRRDYEKLLKKGYAIFWVPRESIVRELSNAKDEGARKLIVVSGRQFIVDDCRVVADGISKKSLNNAKLHLLAALDSLEASNFRAAQSTSSVCLDALLDQIIDTSALSRFPEISTKMSDDSKRLTSIDDIPVQYTYAALQSLLLLYSFRKFDRLRPKTVSTKYGRHSSIHSIDGRQYTEFNSIQGVMILSSILATTDRLGDGWLSELASYT